MLLDRVPRVSLPGIDLIRKGDVAKLVVEHVVHHAHQLRRVPILRPIDVAPREICVGLTIGRLPEVIEFTEDVVDLALVGVIILFESDFDTRSRTERWISYP